MTHNHFQAKDALLIMNSVESKPIVLVVDDNYPAAEMVSTLFRNYEYEVLTAYNGEDAIILAKKNLPDLILLDVMMPGMDGIEVLKAIRNDPTTQNIPAMLITAKDTPRDVELGFASGADDYIPKPVDPRELLARAKSKIESRQLREALENRTRDLEALMRVSEELNNQLDINTLSDIILYLIIDLLPCQNVYFIRFDENQVVVDQKMVDEHGIEFDEKGYSVELLNSVDFQNSDTISVWSDGESEYIAAKLIHGNQLHAVIILANRSKYTPSNVRLFEGIARQATLALRNAESYEIKVNYAEMLEKTVAERTEELRSAQQLLIRSEKLASVGRLAAGIAHEINNPLQPILINLELLAEDIHANQPINPRDIEDTLISAQRISRIVERLLQFTRKRTDETPPMEIVKLHEVVDSVLTLSQKSLQRDNVSFTLNFDQDVSIYGNRDQLEQVVLNLLLNARAAILSGGNVSISIFTEEDKAILLVEDNGSGIPHDLLEQIFEPFVTTKETGTGLGLFISHEIMENHSGTISVESEEGVGSKFKLAFPLYITE